MTEDQSSNGSASKDARKKPRRTPSKEARLKYIARTHRREVDTRRRYEWRTITATMAFYVLSAAAALKDGSPRFESLGQRTTVWMIWIALVFAAIFYLYGLLKADRFNRRVAHAAENELIRQLDVKALTDLLPSQGAAVAGPPWWAVIWPIAAMLITAATSAAIITFRP